jgi:hypothetical protein
MRPVSMENVAPLSSMDTLYGLFNKAHYSYYDERNVSR